MSKKFEPSRVIGPEDVKVNQYVTITHVTYEFLADDCFALPRAEIAPSRVTLMHGCAGRPLKVVGVCLPFVLVEDPAGTHSTVDLRKCQIALLNARFGRKAFKMLKTGAATPGCR